MRSVQLDHHHWTVRHGYDPGFLRRMRARRRNWKLSDEVTDDINGVGGGINAK